MERGAWIGGIAVVAVLAVFAAAFVMMGFGDGPDAGNGITGSRKMVAPAAVTKPSTEWRKSPTQPGKPRLEGDLPEKPPIVTADGVMRKPNPEGLGADKWAEIMAEKNRDQEVRARGVVEAFAVNLSPSDGERLHEIFENLFESSSSIRGQMMDGTLERNVARDQMGELRANTITDLTTLLGGEKFAQLRTELRRADAPWF
ncbi:MAG: hypothetical protein R3F61_09300 [Myxococcota bacterium]